MFIIANNGLQVERKLKESIVSLFVQYTQNLRELIASDEMALASTLCDPKRSANLLRTDYLYSSAWSYRTGKRIRTSLESENKTQLTSMMHKSKRPALK